MELTFDIDSYMKKFRVFNPKTLFPPSKEEFVLSISKGLCPICQRKIYWKKDLSIGYCRSKFKDGFIIRRNNYLRLGGK